MRITTRICRLLLGLAVLAGCGGDSTEWHAKSIAGLMPELSFQLVDETGHAVDAGDFRGKVVMLFFGFTHCHDYCPTTLSKLTQSLKALPGDMRDDVLILFVSVDPGRDTVEDLAVYTGNFGPRVIGLTGDDDDLRDLAKRYRTTFSYGEPDEHGNYMVSHGRAVYVFDSRGRARLMILNGQSAELIAQDLRQLIEATG